MHVHFSFVGYLIEDTLCVASNDSVGILLQHARVASAHFCLGVVVAWAWLQSPVQRRLEPVLRAAESLTDRVRRHRTRILAQHARQIVRSGTR